MPWDGNPGTSGEPTTTGKDFLMTLQMIFKNTVKITAFTFFISIFFFYSCSKNNPAKPGNDNKNANTGKAIDSAGGEIVQDELTLTIPPAAFSSSATISINPLDQEKPFGENHASKLYTIEGLPPNYSRPLDIAIKYNKTGDSGKYYLVLGQEELSDAGITTGYTILESVDSTGYIVGKLPVMLQGEATGSGGGLRKPGENDDPRPTMGVIKAVEKISAQGHFKIVYPEIYEDTDWITDLAGYLEEAYVTIQDMGFSYDLRTKWPLTVTVMDMGQDLDGASYRSKLGYNYGYMEFNQNKIHDTKQMRFTAGHEFFHIVQALYDWRWFDTQWAGRLPNHYWFDEASAAWIEEKFTDLANVIPPSRKDLMAPLNGLQKTPSFFGYVYTQAQKDSLTALQNHGYGASAVVKYLVDHYGEEALLQVYKDIYNQKYVIDALSQQMPSDWYIDFVKKYVTNKVYPDFSRSNLFNNRAGEFRIQTAVDTLASFSETLQDLSVKTYAVIIKYPNLDSKSQLIFELSGVEEQHLLVYGYVAGDLQMTLLDSSDYKIVLKDIAKYNGSGMLIAIACNGRILEPYDKTQELKLDVKLKKDDFDHSLQYDYCTVDLFIDCDYQVFANDELTREFSQEKIWPFVTDGSFTGNTFSAKYGEPGDTFVGEMHATLNEDHTMITTLEWTHIYNDPYNPSNQHTVFSAHDIPIDDPAAGSFKLSGPDVCNMFSLDFTQIYQNQKTILKNTNCNENSYIKVTFSKR